MRTPGTRTQLTGGTARKHSGMSAAGVWCLLLVAGLLQACGGTPATGTIQSVDLVPGQTLATGSLIAVVVSGVGECNTLNLDWGDGTVDSSYVKLTAQSQQTHRYSSWGGGKTVTASGSGGCLGSAFTRFRITPLTYSFVVNYPGPNTMACHAMPGKAELPARAQVHAVNVPTVGNVNNNSINFGCLFNGCIFDPEGRAGSSATAPFPFPGFREYSVVWTHGSQQVQGGLDTTFVTLGPAPANLTFCINADLTRNVVGGWQFVITVDELGPPPP